MELEPIPAARASVLHIPHERKTPLRKLYADLMRPPRVQADKDKAPAFAHGQAADRQARGLLVGPTRAGFPGKRPFSRPCAPTVRFAR